MGTNPVTCTALDQCHVPGTCNSADGTCDNPAVVGAAAACGRVCVGGLDGESDITEGVLGSTGRGICMLAMTPSASSHTPPSPLPPSSPPPLSLVNILPACCMWTCYATSKGSSAISMPPLTTRFCLTQADSTTCNDGDACTQTDTCSSGVCHGSNPVTCTASDQCHDVGTCNPADGSCSNPQLVRGDGALNLNWCVVCMLGHATTAVAYHRAYMLGLATVAVAYPRAHMLGLATIAVTYPHSLLQRPHSPTAF